MHIAFFHTEKAERDYPQAWENALMLKERFKPDMAFYETHTSSDWSYADALIPLWGRGDLIVLEQDVLASPHQILGLMQCTCRCCTYTFLNSSTYGNDTYALGARLSDPECNFLLSIEIKDHLPPYATFSGVGLVKIGKELQVRPMHRFTVKTKANGYKGQNCDNAILASCNSHFNPLGLSLTFHVHGTVSHLHK